LTVINLPAIEHALRHLQRAFPQINKELSDRRDPLDDEVLGNMLEGYATVFSATPWTYLRWANSIIGWS
jgi:hypothetical protein